MHPEKFYNQFFWEIQCDFDDKTRSDVGGLVHLCLSLYIERYKCIFLYLQKDVFVCTRILICVYRERSMDRDIWRGLHIFVFTFLDIFVSLSLSLSLSLYFFLFFLFAPPNQTAFKPSTFYFRERKCKLFFF